VMSQAAMPCTPSWNSSTPTAVTTIARIDVQAEQRTKMRRSARKQRGRRRHPVTGHRPLNPVPHSKSGCLASAGYMISMAASASPTSPR
jgi:hypothetical protein